MVGLALSEEAVQSLCNMLPSILEVQQPYSRMVFPKMFLSCNSNGLGSYSWFDLRGIQHFCAHLISNRLQKPTHSISASHLFSSQIRIMWPCSCFECPKLVTLFSKNGLSTRSRGDGNGCWANYPKGDAGAFPWWFVFRCGRGTIDRWQWRPSGWQDEGLYGRALLAFAGT